MVSMLPEVYSFVLQTRDGAPLDVGPLVVGYALCRRHQIRAMEHLEFEEPMAVEIMRSLRMGDVDAVSRYAGVMDGLADAVGHLCGDEGRDRFLIHCDEIWEALMAGELIPAWEAQ